MPNYASITDILHLSISMRKKLINLIMKSFLPEQRQTLSLFS